MLPTRVLWYVFFRYNAYSSNGTVYTLMEISVNSNPRLWGLEITGFTPTIDYFGQGKVLSLVRPSTRHPLLDSTFGSSNLHCNTYASEINSLDRMTHICVSKLTTIGSGNCLSPARHQTAIWTNAGILVIEKIQWNLNRNLYIFIQEIVQ